MSADRRQNPKGRRRGGRCGGSESRGFTLIETMIATLILVFSLLAVAGLFSWAVRTNMYTDELTTGTLLATAKIEDLSSVRRISDLTVGGGLDASSPTTGFFEYVSVGSDGTVTADTSTPTAPYMRLWEVSGTNPVLITVSVYVQSSRVSRQPIELVRATTELTNAY